MLDAKKAVPVFLVLLMGSLSAQITTHDVSLLCYALKRISQMNYGAQISVEEQAALQHTLGFDPLHLIGGSSTNGWVAGLNIARSSNSCFRGKHHLLMCTFVRNQADRLNEFLAHHYVQGFNNFIIYDDNSSDNTHQVLQPWIRANIVTYLPAVPELPLHKYGHAGSQYASYRHCFDHFATSFEWVAWLDADERVVPLVNMCFTDVLHRYREKGGLSINFQYVNDARTRLTYTNTSLFDMEITGFLKGTYHAAVKPIVHVNSSSGPVWHMPHCAGWKQGFQGVDELGHAMVTGVVSGQECRCWARCNGSEASIVQISHYQYVTTKQLMQKMLRDFDANRRHKYAWKPYDPVQTCKKHFLQALTAVQADVRLSNIAYTRDAIITPAKQLLGIV